MDEKTKAKILELIFFIFVGLIFGISLWFNDFVAGGALGVFIFFILWLFAQVKDEDEAIFPIYIKREMYEGTKVKIGKMGIYDMIFPKDLPDVAMEGYPTPWISSYGGNGHDYIYDAGGKPVFHVYCWDKEDNVLFNKKMQSINGDDKQY